MKTLEALSSKTARVGDPVALEVTEDVRINGRVVVARGSKAHGEITLVKKSGMGGKAGDLAIRPDYVQGDLKLELRGTEDTEGSLKTRRVWPLLWLKRRFSPGRPPTS
jgi:hypothetical protein